MQAAPAPLLDTLRRVDTPEGITLRLNAAGPLPRAAAWAIDFMIRFAVVAFAAAPLGLLGDVGAGLSLLLLFSTIWLYPILFEVLRDGQTLGKRVMGLRVIHDNGTPVGWMASIVRNLLRTVDMLPVLYGFGVASSLVDPQGRRLGDLVAGTLVVHVHTPRAASAAPAVPSVMPAQALQAAEKAAIVEFAERSAGLTAERQQELADLLAPLTGARGAVGVQRLLGMANGFLGRH